MKIIERMRRGRSERIAQRSRLFLVGCGVISLLFALPGPATAAVSAGVAAANSGAQVWAARFGSAGKDFPTTVGVSPDGTKVFVTGRTGDYATVAYNAANGTQLWAASYNGPGNDVDIAYSLGVSPDGTKVYVTGRIVVTGGGWDYATIAYNTANGSQLWVARYNGPSDGADFASSLGVSPDGTKVYVTGTSDGGATAADYATVAYNSADGAQLWVARYNGPSGRDEASSLGVSPDGTKVYVTGTSDGSATAEDYATVAYNAANGAQLWVARYNFLAANGGDFAYSLGVSRDGTRVFVTGTSAGSTSQDYATVAYNTANGTQLWAARYNGPGNGFDAPYSLGVSPDGTKVFISGRAGSAWDYATVAYRAADGAQLWVKGYNGPGNRQDNAVSLGVSPDGTKVYVTGTSDGSNMIADYATIAYNAADGTQLWVARYDGGNGIDYASSLVVSPDGTMVFVTGLSDGGTSFWDYGTVAYNTVSSHPPNIFEVVIKQCKNLHVGYNYFPAGTVVHWNMSQGDVKVSSNNQFTTLGGGREYHFLTMPIGTTLQPDPDARVRFSWTINGVLFHYVITRDNGC